jgi:hypothetical protein
MARRKGADPPAAHSALEPGVIATMLCSLLLRRLCLVSSPHNSAWRLVFNLKSYGKSPFGRRVAETKTHLDELDHLNNTVHISDRLDTPCARATTFFSSRSSDAEAPG